MDEVDNINKKSLDTEEIGKHNIDAGKSNIEFKEVTIKWPGSSVQENINVLSGISFMVGSGQIVTVVGEVGSGKVSNTTTLSSSIIVPARLKVYLGKIIYRSF